MPAPLSHPRLDKVLVVSGDAGEGNSIASALIESGHGVDLAWDGFEALHRLYQWRPDLVVLDEFLPRMDGWETCRRIRDICDVPVLMVTGESTGTEQLDVLLSGADGFLQRPVRLPLLLERAQILLATGRPSLHPWAPREVRLDGLRIDLAADEVELDGQRVDLSPTEYRLLVALASGPACGLTQAELLSRVWGPDYLDQISFLDLSICKLRLKIEEDPSSPRWILSDPGGIYRLGARPTSRAMLLD